MSSKPSDPKVLEYAPAYKNRTPPARALVLVAVAGDVTAGEEFDLPPFDPLPIGRSAKGIQLTDPLVSIQHAVISHDAKRGYVVEDLKSATGTWVDEECVRGESRPIGVGTRLRFGDTVFEVQPAHRTPRWVRLVAIGVVGLMFVAVVVFAAQQFVAPPEPELQCPDTDLVGAAPLRSIRVPPAFLRDRGLLTGDLVCRRTTDEDDDGRAEAWLQAADGRQFVATPADGVGREEGWNLLGELPRDCTQRSQDDGAAEFPILDCAGKQWMFIDGAYQFVGHEGVVVWYREGAVEEPVEEAPKGKAPEPPPKLIELPGLAADANRGPIKVGRFALRSEDRLGAFLAFRGIDRPVHYLICEEAFEGISAQALTDDENVSQLKIGCISDLRLTGSPGAKPVAIALSPAGRRALVDDVTTFYAGNPDGLFLDGRWLEVVDQISQEPGFLVGARKLIGDTKESDAAPLTPMPDPLRPITVAHVLDARDARLEAAPIATSVGLVKEGLATIDPPGCSVVEVRTNTYVRFGFSSLVSQPFLTLTEVGCGERRELGTVGYTSTVQDFGLEGLQLRVATESRASSRGLQVARARLSWRPAE
jgi:hypothetical protein